MESRTGMRVAPVSDLDWYEILTDMRVGLV
jgi:hypothetical protein